MKTYSRLTLVLAFSLLTIASGVFFTAPTFGDSLSGSETFDVQQFLSEAKAQKVAEAGKKGALIGLIIGLVIAYVMSPIDQQRWLKVAMVIGAVTGGYFGSTFSAENSGVSSKVAFELQSRMERAAVKLAMRELGNEVIRMDRVGIDTVGLNKVLKSVADITVEKETAVSTKDVDMFDNQLQRLVPALQKQLDAVIGSVDSLTEFSTAFGGAGMDLAINIANLTGMSVQEMFDEINKKIKTAQLGKQINKDRRESMKRQAEVNDQLDAFVDGMKDAIDALNGLTGSIDATAAMALGEDITTTYGQGALGTKILSRAGAGDSVNQESLGRAIDITAPNASVAKAAKSMAEVQSELPEILRRAAAESEMNNDSLPLRVQKSLENRFGADNALIPEIMKQLRQDTQNVQSGGEGGLAPDIIADARSFSERYAKGAFQPMMDKLQTVADLMIEQEEKLINSMERRRKVEDDISPREEKGRQKRNQLADFERTQLNPALTGQPARQLSVDEIFKRDEQRIRQAMGGDRAPSGGLAGDVGAMGSRLQEINRQRADLSRLMNSADKAGGSMEEMVVKMDALNKEADSLGDGLEAATDSAEAFAEIDKLLDEIRGERGVRSGLLEDFAWGGGDDRQRVRMGVIGAQAVAGGASPDQLLVPGQKDATRDLLKAIGDNRSGLLFGKTGTQVLEEGTRRQIVNYLQELDLEMDEEEINELVKLTTQASQTEKDLLRKQQDILKNQLNAENQILDIQIQQLTALEVLIAGLVKEGPQVRKVAEARVATRKTGMLEDKAQASRDRALSAQDAGQRLTTGRSMTLDDGSTVSFGSLTEDQMKRFSDPNERAKLDKLRDKREAERKAATMPSSVNLKMTTSERASYDAAKQAEQDATESGDPNAIKAAKEGASSSMRKYLERIFGTENVTATDVATALQKSYDGGDGLKKFVVSRRKSIGQEGIDAQTEAKNLEQQLMKGTGGLSGTQLFNLLQNPQLFDALAKDIELYMKSMPKEQTEPVEDTKQVTPDSAQKPTAAETMQSSKPQKRSNRRRRMKTRALLSSHETIAQSVRLRF